LFGSRKIEQLQKEFARHQSNDGRRNSDLRRRIHALEELRRDDLEDVSEVDRELQSTRDQVRKLTGWSDSYRNVLEEIAKNLNTQRRRNILHSQTLLALIADAQIKQQAISDLLLFTGVGDEPLTEQHVQHLREAGIYPKDGITFAEYFRGNPSDVQTEVNIDGVRGSAHRFNFRGPHSAGQVTEEDIRQFVNEYLGEENVDIDRLDDDGNPHGTPTDELSEALQDVTSFLTDYLNGSRNEVIVSDADLGTWNVIPDANGMTIEFTAAQPPTNPTLTNAQPDFCR
jgi:hypothetical protein